MKKNYLVFLLLALVLIIGFTFLKIAKKTAQESVDKRVQGVILPHHDLAAEFLSESLEKLSQGINPEVVVIYGTNHYFPIGDTYTTTTEVKKGYSLNGVLADNSRVKNDHSIQTILPYVQKYFPDAKVIPILVSAKYTNLEGLKNDAATFVAKFGKENTLYLASVDFAHNVTLEEGLDNNNDSIESISGFNYSKILQYSDNHMDSPLAITSLLLTMQNLGSVNWQTWYSSHGALLTGKLNLKGTSYVVGVFTY